MDDSPYSGEPSVGALSKLRTVLALRKATQSADGAFHKFSLLRVTTNEGEGEQMPVTRDAQLALLIPEFTLSGPTTSLVLRWKSMYSTIDPGKREPYTIGEWLEIIPSRIGHSRTVDTALDCLINSAVAYINRNEQNFAKTYDLNARALARIRTILSGGDSRKIQDDALIAISLLTGAEVRLYPVVRDNRN